MGSSPPRGVFTSSPQNCSPGDVCYRHACLVRGGKKRILGVMVMVMMGINVCLTNLGQLCVDAAEAGERQSQH